jgi:hypothetical protein
MAITNAAENNENTDIQTREALQRRNHNVLSVIHGVPNLWFHHCIMDCTKHHITHSRGKSSIEGFSKFLNTIHREVLEIENCLKFKNILMPNEKVWGGLQYCYMQ